MSSKATNPTNMTSSTKPRDTSDVVTVVRPPRRGWQGWILISFVFIAGAASLSIEFAASRLLAPYFGTSLFVWANLIGLILLYLTVGYYVGGRLADSHPRPALLYGLAVVAALLIAIIPLFAPAILSWTQALFATAQLGVFYGSLVSVLLLFSLPMILLGCVSPFAIRLSVKQLVQSGRTSGQLYALSTLGSIFGTFFPVFVLIPYVGTKMTFLLTAVALLLVSVVGLLLSRRIEIDKHPAV